MYAIATKPNIDKIFLKLKNKDPEQLKIVYRKIEQIIMNPYHFKPLRGDMHGSRRVHIGKSFVLVYEIYEKEKVVTLLDYDHHDKIY